MLRANIFVDGSNLTGALTRFHTTVENHPAFFKFIFKTAIEAWSSSFLSPLSENVALSRVSWYVVGSMDHLDAHLFNGIKKVFQEDETLKRLYAEETGSVLGSEESWEAFMKDVRLWYDRKTKSLADQKNFYRKMQLHCDFIDLKEVGHWKLDFAHRSTNEKGIDTKFSVDMVTQRDNFDLAILISGDADGIPAIEYLKSQGKAVTVVDFVQDHQEYGKGNYFSQKLKASSDFMTSIKIEDLISANIAIRR